MTAADQCKVVRRRNTQRVDYVREPLVDKVWDIIMNFLHKQPHAKIFDPLAPVRRTEVRSTFTDYD